MRIQQSNSSTSNNVSTPGSGGAPAAGGEAPKALNSFQRVPSSSVMAKALRALTSRVDPDSVEGQIQALFIEQFSAKAQDHAAFHAFMQQVFGENYNFIKAEAYRRNALAGDFSWLPRIEFLSDEELMGANGAYSAQSGVVYINETLKNDLELAASTFVEEAGHHLDAMLNETDSAGDEGELFRRLAANEPLSGAQIYQIRAENDSGTIVVNGKEVKVEFWNPLKAAGRAWRATKKALRKVSRSAKEVVVGAARAAREATVGAVKSVGHALADVASGVDAAVTGCLKESYKGITGFWKHLVAGKGKAAFVALWTGFDKGFLQAPARLSNGLFDAADHLVDATASLLKPFGLKKFTKAVGERAVDIFRNTTNTLLAIGRDIINTPVEAVAGFINDHVEGLTSLFKGEFKEAFTKFGMAYVKRAGRIIGGVVDITMRAGALIGSILGVAVGIESPGRPLSAEEKEWFRKVYGDNIDLDVVRIKRGGLVCLAGDANKAVGNTIYLKKELFDSQGRLTKAGTLTLAHEMGHVWQNQNDGGDYIHKAQASYIRDAKGAYQWKEHMEKKVPFESLTPDQQAQVIKEISKRVLNNNWEEPQTPRPGATQEEQEEYQKKKKEWDYLVLAAKKIKA